MSKTKYFAVIQYATLDGEWRDARKDETNCAYFPLDKDAMRKDLRYFRLFAGQDRVRIEIQTKEG